MKDKPEYDSVITKINEHLEDIVRKLSVDEFQDIHFDGDINKCIIKYCNNRG